MSFFERAREFRGTGGGAAPKRLGTTRALGKSLADDGGQFNALYCSAFCGGWAYANDLPRFDEAMTDIGTFGDGWRSIAVLGGVSWQDRMVSTEPLSKWIEINKEANRRGYREHGQRCAFTVFGGQDNGADTPEKRRRITEAAVHVIKGDEECYLFVELFNEAYDEGMGNAELRTLAEWLQSQVSVPVAISTPNHIAGDFEDLYSKARVQAVTFHVDRKTDDGPAEPIWNLYETLWPAHRPPLVFSNEPPGPDSSLYAEKDSRRLVAAFVIASQIGAGYCYHPGPGKRLGGSWEPHIPARIRDTHGFLETTQGFRAMRALLPSGMANWQFWAGHMGDNPIRTERRDDYDDGGLFKRLTVSNGHSFVDLSLGVKRDCQHTTPMPLKEIDLVTGDVIREVSGTYRLNPARSETLFVGGL